jgi:DNA polymerase-1
MLLLIDADIPAYRATTVCEQEIEWEDDVWSVYTDLGEAKELFKKYLKKFQDDTGYEDFKLCFSSRTNFRKVLNPNYKSNRKSRKPVGYGALKEWAQATYPSFEKPGIEADDCLGILATKFPGKTVIVTLDKDLKTIAGRMWHLSPDLSGKWVTSTEEDGNRQFLKQALMGDSVDGFAGCPGMGPVGATKLLEKNGYKWETVRQAYLKAGLTEEDAIMNARMAYILRVENWDEEKQEVKLWTP